MCSWSTHFQHRDLSRSPQALQRTLALEDAVSLEPCISEASTGPSDGLPFKTVLLSLLSPGVSAGGYVERKLQQATPPIPGPVPLGLAPEPVNTPYDIPGSGGYEGPGPAGPDLFGYPYGPPGDSDAPYGAGPDGPGPFGLELPYFPPEDTDSPPPSGPGPLFDEVFGNITREPGGWSVLDVVQGLGTCRQFCPIA